ncbi:glycosyltransferase [Desulfobaculum sp. SPO524]|uniref:glycosyltransferase n=1 Tax=Desulfobaculum sp. SPO524 TaxID=3378071 RepID=UPI0038526A32
MKVALVHYWLVNRRGGERVLEALCEMYPQADIFTHVYAPAAMSDTINARRVQTSFIGRLPRIAKWYQYALPLMPLALEQLDLRGYDLVISSESGPAKGVITGPDTTHVCYCHSPMRYVWDMYHDYVASAGTLKRALIAPLMHYLRLWDRLSADRVDKFVANSAFVQRRIRKHYRRRATVVHPPVEVDAFTHDAPREDFYLMVGELVGYKRADLAVRACSRTGKRLVVIGGGEQLEDLKTMAGPSVTIMGRQPFSVIRDYMSRCRALLFPGKEDFGIVPVEAMASGAPVIAFGQGGALETVKDGVTGRFFHEQTEESLLAAITAFEETLEAYSTSAIRAHAEAFGPQRFKDDMQRAIDAAMAAS